MRNEKNYPTVRAPEPGRRVTGREQFHIQPKTDVRGFCPPEWAAKPYALYR